MLSTVAYVCAYVTAVLFLSGLLVKVIRYKRNPMHLRWELYPVAHEAGKAEYGGSYLEETDWEMKGRRKSLIGELRVMVPEIIFLKTIYESNRSLWFVSFPFHLGLYCTVGFVLVLFWGAATGTRLDLLLNCFGLCGCTLSIIGALGLIWRRAADDHLRDYTSFAHHFNLGLFVVASGFALRAWYVEGFSFAGFGDFTANLVRMNLNQPIHSPVIAPVVLGSVLIAYIPWTHMAHFFMKYFLYHDIRWGDAPMSQTRQAEDKLHEVLHYTPSWAAEHVQADGQKTWADLAMHNPAQKESRK